MKRHRRQARHQPQQQTAQHQKNRVRDADLLRDRGEGQHHREQQDNDFQLMQAFHRVRPWDAPTVGYIPIVSSR